MLDKCIIHLHLGGFGSCWSCIDSHIQLIIGPERLESTRALKLTEHRLLEVGRLRTRGHVHLGLLEVRLLELLLHSLLRWISRGTLGLAPWHLGLELLHPDLLLLGQAQVSIREELLDVAEAALGAHRPLSVPV